jgi:uncharacterized protein YjlB
MPRHLLYFKDDGDIPNHPRWPLLLYPRALDPETLARSETAFDELFAKNDWIVRFRAGIYSFIHYHSNAHEVLGVARGHATVHFGLALGKWRALLKERGAFHGQAAATVWEGI